MIKPGIRRTVPFLSHSNTVILKLTSWVTQGHRNQHISVRNGIIFPILTITLLTLTLTLTLTLSLTLTPAVTLYTNINTQWRRQLVGTWCPLAFEKKSFHYVETSSLIWFNTMPHCNSALFVQPYSVWNNTVDIVKHLSRPGSPMILVFLTPGADIQFHGEPLRLGHKIHGGGKICDFRLKSLFISETVRARPIVAIKCL